MVLKQNSFYSTWQRSIYKILVFILITNTLISPPNSNIITEESNSTIDRKQRKKVKYHIIANRIIDPSGFRNFFPKYFPKESTAEYIVNTAVGILRSKGIDYRAIHIEKSKNNNNLFLVVITIEEPRDTPLQIGEKQVNEGDNIIFRRILFDQSLKPIEDKIKEGKKQHNQQISLINTTCNSSKRRGIIQFASLMRNQYGFIHNYIHSKENNRILIFEDYHKDIKYPDLQKLQFIFVKYKNGVAQYSNTVPDSLDLEKMKQFLMIEENKGMALLLSMFSNAPLCRMFIREGKPLEDYVLSRGYNQCQLLELKFFYQNDKASAFVYILIGEKLPAYKISFSSDLPNSIALLQELSKLESNLLTNKKILEKGYIPSSIKRICENKITHPYFINKTISEISSKNLLEVGNSIKNSLNSGYLINFDIVSKKSNVHVSNIMFTNNLTIKNPLKNCNVKIGDSFSIKEINKDVKRLEKINKDKVQATFLDDPKTGDKIVIYKISEEMNYQKILTEFIPSFSFNLNGLKLGKNLNFAPQFPNSNLVLPTSLELNLDNKNLDILSHIFPGRKDNTAFCLTTRLILSLAPAILQILNRKPSNDLFLDISGGFSILPFRMLNSNEKEENLTKIQSAVLSCNIGASKKYSNLHFSHQFRLFHEYNQNYAKEEKLLELFGHDKDPNETSYMYEISCGGQSLILEQDISSFTVAFKDSVKDSYSMLFNPMLETVASYKCLFFKHISSENKLQIFWAIKIPEHNTKFRGLKVDKFKIIGVDKYLYGDDRQYSLAFNFLSENIIKCSELDIFMGQKLTISIGAFINALIGRLIEKNEPWEDRTSAGIVIHLRISLGSAKIYLIPIFNSKDPDTTNLFDFNIEGAGDKNIAEKKYWKTQRTALLIDQ